MLLVVNLIASEEEASLTCDKKEVEQAGAGHLLIAMLSHATDSFDKPEVGTGVM